MHSTNIHSHTYTYNHTHTQAHIHTSYRFTYIHMYVHINFSSRSPCFFYYWAVPKVTRYIVSIFVFPLPFRDRQRNCANLNFHFLSRKKMSITRYLQPATVTVSKPTWHPEPFQDAISKHGLTEPLSLVSKHGLAEPPVLPWVLSPCFFFKPT